MNDTTLPGIDQIRQARVRIADAVVNTPCIESRTLGLIAGCQLFLKFENLQFTASFKERGAANRLRTLDPAVARRGVIAVSAGNHAQGVAYHSERMGIPATIVMPRFTPAVKVENTRRFGAQVVLEGDSFQAARDAMLLLAGERKLSIVHPYDDPMIIAGQGTIGLEMLETVPELDCLVIAVGGGGLIAGIAIAARAIKPGIEIVGVQTAGFTGAYRAWQAARHPGQPVAAESSGGPTLAEGIAVEQPGQMNRAVIESLIDHMVLVSEAEIEQAMVLLLDIEKTVVEGAGAAGLAAVLREPGRYAGRKVGLVLCGGNIDMLTLADVMQRQLARQHRLARLSIKAPDSPGSLARIASLVGGEGANIEDVSHQRAFADLPVRYVRIDMTLSIRGDEHLDRVIAALEGGGFRTRRVSDQLLDDLPVVR
ncbi:MAG: threonine ammonia-lyase [Burkholderiaceae bacterium]